MRSRSRSLSFKKSIKKLMKKPMKTKTMKLKTKKFKKSKKTKKSKIKFRFNSKVCTICKRPACQTIYFKRINLPSNDEHFCNLHKLKVINSRETEISNTCQQV